MIALGLWYCAHKNNEKAKEFIEEGKKSAENIKEKSNGQPKQHLEKNINGYNKYLQIINSRLNRANNGSP